MCIICTYTCTMVPADQKYIMPCAMHTQEQQTFKIHLSLSTLRVSWFVMSLRSALPHPSPKRKLIMAILYMWPATVSGSRTLWATQPVRFRCWKGREGEGGEKGNVCAPKDACTTLTFNSPHSLKKLKTPFISVLVAMKWDEVPPIVPNHTCLFDHNLREFEEC